MTVAERILDLFDAAGCGYRLLDHPPAYDAEQAARLRDTPLSEGGKALVMRLDRGIGFAVLALAADRQVDNRALRKHLGVRRYRFATPEELEAHTGLQPGCIPPFGEPVLPLPLYVDQDLAAGERIAFTAGSHTLSVVVATPEWLAVARPTEVFPFAR
ncbi:MAG: YbaK/EbsC family protein [Myxococcota bacterium]